MKLPVLVLWLMASPVMAAPFLTADVVAGVSQCGVVIDGGLKVLVPAAALLCKYDLAGVSIGSHTATMTALSANDPTWGTQESAPSLPFSFVRPGVPPSPSTPRITP